MRLRPTSPQPAPRQHQPRSQPSALDQPHAATQPADTRPNPTRHPPPTRTLGAYPPPTRLPPPEHAQISVSHHTR